MLYWQNKKIYFKDKSFVIKNLPDINSEIIAHCTSSINLTYLMVISYDCYCVIFIIKAVLERPRLERESS
jgi:hypothetical protein